MLFHPFRDESKSPLPPFKIFESVRVRDFRARFFLFDATLKISPILPLPSLPPLPPIIHHTGNNPEMDSRPVQNWSQRGIIHGRRRVQRYFSVAGSSHLRRFLRVTVRVIENNSVTSRMPVIKRNDTDERQPFAARQWSEPWNGHDVRSISSLVVVIVVVVSKPIRGARGEKKEGGNTPERDL